MADLQAVYARTAAGLKEIRARAHPLTPEQRDLLIVLDGQGPLGSFARIVGCAQEAMAELAEPLTRLGLIAPAGVQAEPLAPAPRRPSAEALISLAHQVFGAHAPPIVRKLEKAGASPPELLAAAESAAKLAKLTIDEALASAFLAQARKLFGG